ncbi:DMT family transporter [Cognatishimia sp. MH4019]|uniref:DMT family transporter n=1 Tax=Cognatishimia sp. MH4019 TaxID=2854030 RepID=UPI001CD6AAD3|nr:DMT family transporter [Cognatishimia sp. MH4019]
MLQTRPSAIATLIVISTGILWGFYWLPVRSLQTAGLTGAWGTLAITGAAAIMLAPFVAMRRRRVDRSDLVAIVGIALGGAAFALYSIGFVYGRVAIIILLFFLTPVWSTLIGRYIMGWQTPALRLVAIAIGLLGLGVMLSANGQVPIPRNIGEWMALASGLLWSASTTCIRSKSRLAPPEAAFTFAGGATLVSLILAPLLAPWPDATEAPVALIFVTGGLWWALSMLGLMWATLRLDPARVGILLMSEVLIGIASAAWLAGETLTPVEMLGGALVLGAGVLEIWPQRAKSV